MNDLKAFHLRMTMPSNAISNPLDLTKVDLGGIVNRLEEIKYIEDMGFNNPDNLLMHQEELRALRSNLNIQLLDEDGQKLLEEVSAKLEV